MTKSEKLSGSKASWAGVALTLSLIALPTPVLALTIRGTGDISGEVAAFRAALGEPNNGGTPGPLAVGRREINWDGAGVPFDMPPNFFQGRGAIFSTESGSEFRVSNPGNVANSPVDNRFSSINATYSSEFTTFSPNRLFTSVDTNVLDITFFVAGSDIPAAVSGFGAVFTDVDLSGLTTLEYFDLDGDLLASEAVDPNDKGLSFLGVTFAQPNVFRVRLTAGNTPLGPNDDPGNNVDVVVMDDFLYSEPQAVMIPEPTSWVGLLTLGTWGTSLLLKRRQRNN